MEQRGFKPKPTDRVAKQMVVVREDLQMPLGKLLAQVGHAVLAPVFNAMAKDIYNPGNREGEEWYYRYSILVKPDSAFEAWKEGRFTKVVVVVNSKDELKEVYEKASNLSFRCLITDAGFTIFKEPTLTVASLLGWSDELQPITGHLKLMK